MLWIFMIHIIILSQCTKYYLFSISDWYQALQQQLLTFCRNCYLLFNTTTGIQYKSLTRGSTTTTTSQPICCDKRLWKMLWSATAGYVPHNTSGTDRQKNPRAPWWSHEQMSRLLLLPWGTNLAKDWILWTLLEEAIYNCYLYMYCFLKHEGRCLDMFHLVTASLVWVFVSLLGGILDDIAN